MLLDARMALGMEQLLRRRSLGRLRASFELLDCSPLTVKASLCSDHRKEELTVFASPFAFSSALGLGPGAVVQQGQLLSLLLLPHPRLLLLLLAAGPSPP